MKIKVLMGVMFLLSASLLVLNMDILAKGDAGSAFDGAGEFVSVRHEGKPSGLLPPAKEELTVPIMAHEQVITESDYKTEPAPPKPRGPPRAIDDILEEAREEGRLRAEDHERAHQVELERLKETERKLEQEEAEKEAARVLMMLQQESTYSSDYLDGEEYAFEGEEDVVPVNLPSLGHVWPMPHSMDTANGVAQISLASLCVWDIVSDCPFFRQAVSDYSEVLRADARQLEAKMIVAPVSAAAKLTGIVIEHVDGPEDTREERLVNNLFHGAQIPFGYNEGYRLTVPTSGSIRIEASDSYGVIHAFTTLKQLLARPSDGGGHADVFMVPGVPIAVSDSPVFPYRGFMIDSGRSFLSLDLIKRTIDAMSLLKLNVLHWHLADDQSFPIQCLAYPELQKMGAYWMGYVWDKVPIDKGEYSQDDLREVVAYAMVRGIRVIPEVDVPGHCRGWTMAFPEMTVECPKYQKDKRNIQDSQKFKNGDYHVNMPLDVTSDLVYEVVGTFMHEMAEIFPDPVFHIGSDEAPDACWSEDLAFLTRLAHLTSDRPQAYFLSRLRERLTDFPVFANRTLTVWDDGYPSLYASDIENGEVVVQFWRSWSGPARKLPTISDTSFLVLSPSAWYLDIPRPEPEITNWEKTYLDMSFDSFQQGTNGKVLGGEACAWMMTESMHRSRGGTWPIHFDTLVWHRLIAIAERLWTRGVTQPPPAARYEAARCRLASVVPVQPAASVQCT